MKVGKRRTQVCTYHNFNIEFASSGLSCVDDKLLGHRARNFLRRIADHFDVGRLRLRLQLQIEGTLRDILASGTNLDFAGGLLILRRDIVHGEFAISKVRDFDWTNRAIWRKSTNTLFIIKHV